MMVGIGGGLDLDRGVTSHGRRKSWPIHSIACIFLQKVSSFGSHHFDGGDVCIVLSIGLLHLQRSYDDV
jgi:hypothetical protein